MNEAEVRKYHAAGRFLLLLVQQRAGRAAEAGCRMWIRGGESMSLVAVPDKMAQRDASKATTLC